MDIRSLRYFMAVYEEKSFSAAAKRCFVAQPSISTAIAQLEETLNVELFVRHSKGVSPTESGTQLYPHASKLIQDMQALPLLFHETELPLELSISVRPFLSGQLVSQVIKQLIAPLPNLRLQLVDAAEPADLRLTCHRYLSADDIFHPLWEDNYVLAMPINHALSKQKSITLKDLHGVPFISRTPCDIIESWEYAIHKKDVKMDVRAQVTTEEYALDLVAAGLGISLIPEHSAGQRNDICLRPLSGIEFKRVVGISHNKDQGLPSTILNCILACKQHLQDNAYQAKDIA
jgi:LysR family transcriptional regulator, benzoate and cis,cis-muconate-responsive activator of ben and cat genes